MAFTSWRGTMGLIKPTCRPGSPEETIRLLPEGIGLAEGTRTEFLRTLGAIEEREVYRHARAANFAHPEADMIHLLGGGVRATERHFLTRQPSSRCRWLLAELLPSVA